MQNRYLHNVAALACTSCAAFALLLTAFVPGVVARQQPQAVWNGAYTTAQAKRGEALIIHADVDAPFYPTSIEVEGRHRDLLELFAIPTPGKVGEVDLSARRRAIRPVGEWNTIEISSNGGHVQTRLNEVPVSSLKTDAYDYAGHIAFQIQGAKMYWRNMRIRVD